MLVHADWDYDDPILTEDYDRVLDARREDAYEEQVRALRVANDALIVLAECRGLPERELDALLDAWNKLEAAL